MKTAIYVLPEENIEISYPNWVHWFMRSIWRHLKIKTTKNLCNGKKIELVCFDEFVNYPVKKGKKTK